MNRLLCCLILLLLSTSFACAEEEMKAGIAPSFMMSTSAKVEELDPFWGGAGYFLQGCMRCTIGIYVGKVKMNVPAGSGVKLASSTDILTEITFDYIHRLNKDQAERQLGPYIGGGLGWASEQAKATVEVYGQEFESEIKANSLVIEFVGGTTSEQVDFSGGYQLFPGSDNVTGALVFYIAIFL